VPKSWGLLPYLTNHRLNVFAQVVEWSECRSIGGMDVDVEPSEDGLGCLLQAVQIVPPARAGKLVFEVAPQALDEIELWCVGGQKERLELRRMGAPPLAQRTASVIASVLEHNYEGFP
jgi:hypothetical protein